LEEEVCSAQFEVQSLSSGSPIGLALDEGDRYAHHGKNMYEQVVISQTGAEKEDGWGQIDFFYSNPLLRAAKGGVGEPPHASQ
jgi:hypothetical protein